MITTRFSDILDLSDLPAIYTGNTLNIKFILKHIRKKRSKVQKVTRREAPRGLFS